MLVKPLSLRLRLGSLLLLLTAAASLAAADNLIAFPGALGAAAQTPGGRGGKIIRVTTLAASGPGSLLEALETKGPRIVVFEVGGVIDMQKHEIKIKEPFPTRKALFDIAVAGPLAGFAVLVPLLFYAVHRSTLVTGAPMPPGTINFGEPLLFQLMAWMKFGSVGDQWQLNLHPIGFAAWFGMLATAWNLLPFGQLDGGHLSYATLGDRSRFLSFATVVASIGMCFVSKSWIVMTAMMVAMLYFFGPRHPPVIDDYEPLGRGRHVIAILAVVLFVLCFTPVPIDIVN